MRFQQNANALARRCRVHDDVVDTFLIKIFCGTVELMRLSYHIKLCAVDGTVDVAVVVDDRDLTFAVRRLLTLRRYWRWNDLARSLIDVLSLSTGGRYIVRFHDTPVADGRGEQQLTRLMRRSCVGDP